MSTFVNFKFGMVEKYNNIIDETLGKNDPK
jgi:hypothetical protein